MSKKAIAILLCFVLVCGMISFRSFPAKAEDSKNPAIQPLTAVRQITALQPVDGVEAWDECWFGNNRTVTADLSTNPGIAFSLTISTSTIFTKDLPAGYDPEKLIRWGKYPGLNIDILHQHGFTGKGAVIAYIDQPAAEHEQYTCDSVHVMNNTNEKSSMHGPAVLSLLKGKETGTAPEAEVYYFAHAAWEADQATHAECLNQIIHQNQSLPEDKKIRMVAFSDNIDEAEKNADLFRETVKACEEAGIMVWFCAEYAPLTFIPYSDKNAFESLAPESRWGNAAPPLVYVPSAGLTTASDEGYIYWAEGGLSWTMPYIFGLYAIALQINPALSQDNLRSFVVDTAYVDGAGRKIVNPVPFIAAVLRSVGRDAEAQALLDEVKARTKYLYAVMDTAALSESDLLAIGEHLAAVTDATVLVVDTAKFTDAQSVYAAMKQDAEWRGGTVAGVQIIGTPAMVPAFSIGYKVQMPEDIDDAGTLLTDLFYGNFDNEPEMLSSGYNVLDHMANGWNIQLVPKWPVARLTLGRDEFDAFFRKYQAFAQDTGLERLEIVNFSNPIFKQMDHSDDMGLFLRNRMDQEFHLLNVPYRLYGNLKGEFPVSGEVLGGFEAENMTAENHKGTVEFIINTHGQWDNIDNAVFVDGQEQRISLVNMGNINEILAINPYYLDAWTCLNGYGMANNLTTTALLGQCVGMFSATAIISNNGVNWRAPLSEMPRSNFYYFYYHYLKALHDGATRSQAFFTAQQAYGEALMSDSKLPLRGEGNYQFNLYNLLAYHNFGVIEPNAAEMVLYASGGLINQAPESVQKAVQSSVSSNRLVLTDGNPDGKERKLEFSARNELPKEFSADVKSITAQPLDNEYIRFTVSYTVSENMGVTVFDPPNGDLFLLRSGTDDSGELVFDLSNENLAWTDSVTLNFNTGDNHLWVFFQTKQLDVPKSERNPLEDKQEDGDTLQKENKETGSPDGIRFSVSNELPSGNSAEVRAVTTQLLDNGNTRFTVFYSIPETLDIAVFDPPNGDQFMLYGKTDDSGEFVFELSKENLAGTEMVTMNFFSGDNHLWVYIRTDQLK